MNNKYDLRFETDEAQSVWSSDGAASLKGTLGGVAQYQDTGFANGTLKGAGVLGNVRATVKVGFGVDYDVNPGTFDAALGYNAQISTPTNAPAVGEAFRLRGEGSLRGDSEMHTTSPSLKANGNFIFENNIRADLQYLFAGKVLDNSVLQLYTPYTEAEVFSMDQNGVKLFSGFGPSKHDDGFISSAPMSNLDYLLEQLHTMDFSTLGATLDYVASPVPGIRASLWADNRSIGSIGVENGAGWQLADTSISIPHIETDARVRGGALVSRGEDQVFHFDLDLDGLVAPTGFQISAGDFFEGRGL